MRGSYNDPMRATHDRETRLVLPPWPVLVIAAVILTINISMVFVGGWTTGVSWDEPYHVERLQNYFDHGWYLLSEYLENGAPAPWVQDTYVYAPVTALVGHAVAVLLRREGLTHIAATADAYAARHLAVGLIAVLGLAAVAGIVRLLFQSWRWGLLAAATMSAIPLWTGHGMFNIKDTPVATGYTFVTLGLILLSTLGVFTSRRLRYTAITTITCGVVVSVGTRPGIWPALAGSVLVMFVATLWSDAQRTTFKRSLGKIAMRAAMILAALISSYLILLVIYPNAFSTPLEVARRAATESAN